MKHLQQLALDPNDPRNRNALKALDDMNESSIRGESFRHLEYDSDLILPVLFLSLVFFGGNTLFSPSNFLVFFHI